MVRKEIKEVIYDAKAKHISGVVFKGNTSVTPVETANNMAKKGQIKDVTAYGDKFITGVKNGKDNDNLLNKVRK